MNNPEYIIIHTAAHGKNDEVYDSSAFQINKWHIANGWNGIGYHYVIRLNGNIESGRSETTSGAHVKGLNSNSIGICFSGHGDIKDFTDEQYKAGITHIRNLMNKYKIPVDKVIGHREINNLIKQGDLHPQYKTSKSCPGTKVDMGALRKALTEGIEVCTCKCECKKCVETKRMNEG